MDAPVDLTKLMGSLAGAKKIMAQEGVMGKNSKTPAINTQGNNSAYDQEKELPTTQYEQKMRSSAPQSNQNSNFINPDLISKSKLPKEIRESLLANPINIDMDPMANKLDDFAAKLNEMAGIEATSSKQEIIQERKVETGGSGLNEAQIRNIVREELMSFFGETMVKSVTEQVIAKFRRKK